MQLAPEMDWTSFTNQAREVSTLNKSSTPKSPLLEVLGDDVGLVIGAGVALQMSFAIETQTLSQLPIPNEQQLRR